MRFFHAFALLMLLAAGILAAAPAFADCATDKQQAMTIVRNLKSTAASDQAKAQAMSEQLSALMDRMSGQSCDTQVLDVYREMQREGVQAR